MGDKTSKCEYSSVQEEAVQPNDYASEAIPEVPNPGGEELHPTAEVPVERPYLEPESSMAQEGNEIGETEVGEEVEPLPEEELPPNEQPLLPPASGNDPN